MVRRYIVLLIKSFLVKDRNCFRESFGFWGVRRASLQHRIRMQKRWGWEAHAPTMMTKTRSSIKLMIVKTTKLERSIEDAKDDEMHEFYKKTSWFMNWNWLPNHSVYEKLQITLELIFSKYVVAVVFKTMHGKEISPLTFSSSETFLWTSMVSVKAPL